MIPFAELLCGLAIILSVCGLALLIAAWIVLPFALSYRVRRLERREDERDEAALILARSIVKESDRTCRSLGRALVIESDRVDKLTQRCDTLERRMEREGGE
jgi:uncharacterized membrane protein YcjF (UPF0283 family)